MRPHVVGTIERVVEAVPRLVAMIGRIARRPIGLAVTVLALIALGALARVPWRIEGADQGVLRLSWRAPAAGSEVCRTLSPEELAALPVHMRREEVCEVERASYRLRVLIDGRIVEDVMVIATGVRGDRPLFVHRDLVLEPGTYRVEVDFQPKAGEGREAADTGATAVAGDRGVGLPIARAAGFSIARDVTLGAGEIVLIKGEE